jgi:hypothetical protein
LISIGQAVLLLRRVKTRLAHKSPPSYAFETLLTEVLRTWSGMVPDRRF